MLERGAEVTDRAELGEDDRAFGVAVEALDLAVDQFEDVAARCVHPLAGRRQRPGGHKRQRRRKLIFCALWTEVCMSFTALDALREGYEVYPVVDAIGGTSPEAHRASLERVTQAGGQPISWVSLTCELQRDWVRQEAETTTM